MLDAANEALTKTQAWRASSTMAMAGLMKASNASRLAGVAMIAARNAPRHSPRPLRKIASQPVPISARCARDNGSAYATHGASGSMVLRINLLLTATNYPRL